MQVHLDPARGGGDVLPVILRSPAFHEAHPDGAHLSQLVDRLKSMVDRLSEKGGELLVVEDLEATTRWDLAHLALCRVMCRKKLFLILSTHHSIIFS